MDSGSCNGCNQVGQDVMDSGSCNGCNEIEQDVMDHVIDHCIHCRM